MKSEEPLSGLELRKAALEAAEELGQAEERERRIAVVGGGHQSLGSIRAATFLGMLSGMGFPVVPILDSMTGPRPQEYVQDEALKVAALARAEAKRARKRARAIIAPGKQNNESIATQREK